MSERNQGWADLPDALLHSIVALSGSFSDLLAFAATCRSWRDALSLYPFKSTLSTLFPPVLLRPDVPVRCPCLSPMLPDKHPCRVIDLASPHSHLCCQIPQVRPCRGNNDPFCFVGASYGHLIFSSNRSCLIVDPFTGVSVSPPQIPGDKNIEVYYGALTVPLGSPNPHLLVTNGPHSYFWRVGSCSWLRASFCDGTVKQIVTLKGQVFGMGYCGMLFAVHWTPWIHILRMQVCGEISIQHLANIYLVACGDMLLLVGWGSFLASGDTFEAFRLDQSTNRPKWVEMEELGNWVIFISTNRRSQPLSFMNPGSGEGGATACTAIPMILNIGLHLSWASPPPIQTSLFS